uniref:Uncharacterized protein n=1 Tax=Anguilla anguilla TaxID=7936 RepID=A0A0E9TGQ6_ANGAN
MCICAPAVMSTT